MPPFDFPASPAVGDTSNGYQWTGEMWAGAPLLGQAPTEQFFDPTGLVNLDISVPAWAKGVEIIGNVYTTGGAAVVMRVSMDGTTFGAGASDYNNTAASHATGTGGYATNATVNSNFMYLGVNADSVIVPVSFSAEMNLTRPNTAALFHLKVYSKQYDGAAAYQYRTWWGNSTVVTALSGSNLAIKALRIMHGTGGIAFPAGSFIKVKWLGDIAQVPPSNGIEDAPSDGGEYVRVNGVWRLKSQSFAMDGAATFDISVPPGAKMMRARGSVQHVAGGGACAARASWDGVNFPVSASDYHSYVGWIHYSGSASPGIFHLVSTVGSTMNLTFNNDGAIVTDMFDWRQNILRPNSTVAWSGLVNSISYQSAAANLYNNSQQRVAVMHTNAGAVLDLKKFRFYPTNGTFGVPSTLDVTWSY